MKRIKKRTRLAFGLFILIFPWILLNLPPVSHYLEILVFAGIFSLVTLGLTMLMGYAGQISLGQAAFFGIGAYFSAILTVQYHWNPWISLLVGIFANSFIALAVGTPSLKLKGHYLAMATLAFGIIVFIIFNEEMQLTGGPDGMGGIPKLALFGYVLDTTLKYYYLVWGTVFGAFLLCVNLIQSSVGRALRAIHDSEIATRSMGINVAKFKIQVFVFSAALASIAGSLFAHYLNFVNPGSFDLSFSIKLITMIVIGGMFNIWGAITGALLITFLSNEWLLAFHEYEVLVYGVILLLVIIFLPEGIVGLPAKIRQATIKGKNWKRRY